jgi:magnesium-dependent phosphatase 1
VSQSLGSFFGKSINMRFAFVVFINSFLITTPFVLTPSPRHSSSLNQAVSDTTPRNPSLIVLDLDGNLWRPEMYELAWDGYGHAPFERIDDTKMKSKLNKVVSLIGDVPELLDEFVLSDEWTKTTQLAISSRTDVPEWAEELLEKFILPQSGKTLKDAISGPWEISGDSKTNHFQRLAKRTGIALQDMVFFDNESENCRSIARLGVTVGYCPNGVKRGIWANTMAAFPNTDGRVIGM